jgi:hypothetical protein
MYNHIGANKIKTAMKLNNSSYVCNSCAQGIKDRILVNWFKESQTGIPGEGFGLLLHLYESQRINFNSFYKMKSPKEKTASGDTSVQLKSIS